MTLFVHKLIRQAIIVLMYCRRWNIESVFLRKFTGSMKRSHCIALQYKPLLGEGKIYKMLPTNLRPHGC